MELTVQENVQGWQPTQSSSTVRFSSWKSPPMAWPNLKKNISKSHLNLESRRGGSNEGDDFSGRKVKKTDLSCNVSSSCTILKQQLTLVVWKGRTGFVPCLPSPGRCHSSTKVSEDIVCSNSRKTSGENLSRNYKWEDNRFFCCCFHHSFVYVSVCMYDGERKWKKIHFLLFKGFPKHVSWKPTPFHICYLVRKMFSPFSEV